MDQNIKNYIDEQLRPLINFKDDFEDLFFNHQHKGVSLDRTKPALPRSFIGSITSAGAASTPFPKNWTSSKTATGVYEITHNLGHTKYVAVALPHAKVYCQLSTKDETTIVVKTFNDAGTATDSALDFILVSEI